MMLGCLLLPATGCLAPAPTTWDEDGDGYTRMVDCIDSNPAINPGAEEVCDGLDNDCDQEVPDNELDADGDGTRACDGDCAPDDPQDYPGAEEVCDGTDNNCDGVVPRVEEDLDGDGFPPCEGDCDDTSLAVRPGATEQCNGLDDDCDGVIPADEQDPDEDGVSDCQGDCDSTDPNRAEGLDEVCDGIDNDCDGIIPEDEEDSDGDGQSVCAGDCDDSDPLNYPGAEELCDGVDNDCDGNIPAIETDADDDGYLGCDDDCDDFDESVRPSAIELCDGIDNDCDGYEILANSQVCMEGSEFRMGCDDTEEALPCQASEGPAHVVVLAAYRIGLYEVTNEEFAAFLNSPMSNCFENLCQDPSVLSQIIGVGGSFSVVPGSEGMPVVGITWEGADQYCRAIDGRLPTEAEWEYAARGSDERFYPWGDFGADCTLAVIADSSSGGTGCGLASPDLVGSRPEGRSPFGLYDMAGNVREWTEDFYSESFYASSPFFNPINRVGDSGRVTRGGSWSQTAVTARTVARGNHPPFDGAENLGFRCAWDEDGGSGLP